MKHNSYFEGKVQSLVVNTSDGPATVGVIEPGKYSFGTDCEEHMHIVAGTLKAKLPNGDWKSYGKGQFFVVPDNGLLTLVADRDGIADKADKELIRTLCTTFLGFEWYAR